MSNGGGGWPPDDVDGYGRGGRHGGDGFGADHDQGRYLDQSGYEWSEASGRSGAQSAGSSYGGSYGQDGFGQGGYRQDSYADAYNQGWQFSNGYADDQRGADGYDRGGYGQGTFGQTGYDSYGEPGYGEPGYGRDGYGRDLGSGRHAGGSFGQGGHGQDRYGRDEYSQDGYSQDGYSQEGYGQVGYRQAEYDADYYGQTAPGRALPAPDGFGGGGVHQDGMGGDSYGRDRYGQESYGYPGQDNGRGAPTGPDSPTLGPGSDQDVTSGYRRDTGSFDRFDQWHDASEDADGWDSDEAAEHDGDWPDEPDGGLLSRRFGSGDDDGRGSSRGPGRRAARAKRPKRLRGKFATIAAILAGALVLGAVADFGYERFQAWHTSRYGDYQGAGTGQVRFIVQSGAVLSSLGPALMKAGVIEELRPFDSAAAAAANASRLQPGLYLLHHHMSSALAVQYLLSPGHRIKDQVTIIEGTRASAIAQALAKQTGIPVSQFTGIIDHPPASLGLPSWAKGKTAEGFLFPDTYTLLPKMTALQVLQMMVTEFKQKVGAINLLAASQKVFTTPWHALIVASLIQAEAGRPSDFGKISRVVWDRLLQGMKLQFDSTVFYAMGKYGTAATAQQQNFPSPYNTYVHTGLPPGPIGNPGIAAIQAAVHASKGPRYLYFVTDTRHKPYITHFTASYQTFLQWKQEFEG